MAKTFALNRGYCHIDDTNLIVSKTLNPEGVRNPKVNFFLVFFGVMLILTIVYAVKNFMRGSAVLSTVYGIAAGIIGLNLVFNWNKNADTCIPLNSISKIEFKPAGTLTGDFFIIKYISKGKTKQKVLVMSRNKKDQKELSKAKKYLSTIVDLV